MKLSQAFVLRLNTQAPPDKATIIWDDELKGFGLLRSPSGRMVWIVKYRSGGRQRKVTLGPVTTILAVPARAKAKELLAQVRLGGDPMADRAAKRDAMTFLTLAERYLALRVRPRLRSKSTSLVERHLLTDAKRLHRRTAGEILRRDIAETLQLVRMRAGKKRMPARAEAPVQANRVRASLSAMYVWGMQQGLVEVNPVAGTAMPFEEKSRERVLTPEELRAVWRHAGSGSFGIAIRLLMLTGARPGEVGGIAGSELALIDPLLSKIGRGRASVERLILWTVPQSRSKNGRPIERLLPEAAVELLELATQKRPDRTFTQNGS